MVGTVESDARSETLMRKQRGNGVLAEMREKGFKLGIGKSASLGWFDIKGFNKSARRCKSSRLIRSCTEAERAEVYAHHVEHVTCVAQENSADVLRAVVLI